MTIEKEIYRGLTSKEKKEKHKASRQEKLKKKKETTRHHENYGDIKISRRIPEEIANQVKSRDQGRDFGRPNHHCLKPGAPHHIIKFEDFLSGKTQGNPHSLENLEAPCSECHKLAHQLNIPSGTSVEEFFKEKFKK